MTFWGKLTTLLVTDFLNAIYHPPKEAHKNLNSFKTYTP